MSRVYDTAAWKRLRARKLFEKPLCEPCLKRGKHIIAEHVDHSVSVASGGPWYPPLDGLMSLCPSCHSIKTNAMDRAGGRGLAFPGCDEDGLPLDPSHPAWAYPLEGPGAVERTPAPKSSFRLVAKGSQ